MAAAELVLDETDVELLNEDETKLLDEETVAESLLLEDPERILLSD